MIHHQDEHTTIHHGDCIDILRELPDNSVDSVVTDPPYALSFMGKDWDTHLTPRQFQDWCEQWATECLRVLRPGGHMLAFGGTRTWHRLACAVEDAGFEIRDSIAWLYGSGFPKSLDVSKAIDKAGGNPLAFKAFAEAYAEAVKASPFNHSDIDKHLNIKGSSCYWARSDHRGGMPPRHHWEAVRSLLNLSAEFERIYDEAEREVTQVAKRDAVMGETISFDQRSSTERERRDIPVTTEAEKWAGWGTALKPAFEPVVVGRKPVENELVFGRFGDAERVSTATGKPAFEPVVVGRKPLEGKTVAANVLQWGTGALNIDASRIGAESTQRARTTADFGIINDDGWTPQPGTNGSPSGRWPANVVLDESQAAALDAMEGGKSVNRSAVWRSTDERVVRDVYGKGSGARVEGQVRSGFGDTGGASRFFYCAKAPKSERPTVDGVAHATVKPLTLMRWLITLVTPPGGKVLEPFAGSGTTVEAAIMDGFRCVAIEREKEYLPLIMARIHRQAQARAAAAFVKEAEQPDLFSDEPETPKPAGRWPANVVLDPQMAEVLDEQSGITSSPSGLISGPKTHGGMMGERLDGDLRQSVSGHGDTGGASRFFKVAEPDNEETE